MKINETPLTIINVETKEERDFGLKVIKALAMLSMETLRQYREDVMKMLTEDGAEPELIVFFDVAIKCAMKEKERVV